MAPRPGTANAKRKRGSVARKRGAATVVEEATDWVLESTGVERRSELARRAAVAVRIAAMGAALAAAACAARSDHAPDVATEGASVAVDSISRLPLTVVQAATAARAAQFAIILTGDGGWASIDKEIADSLAKHGIPVVGLDSRAYLHTKRSPEEVTDDVARMMRYYARTFARREVVLIGYSRGADMLPFVVNRLPSELRGKVRLIALLGIAPNANFKFHLIDLVSNHHRDDDLPTLPELMEMHEPHTLCFYGEKEKDAACRSLPDSVATVVAMPDGHHFGGKYGVIADRILSALGGAITPSQPGSSDSAAAREPRHY